MVLSMRWISARLAGRKARSARSAMRSIVAMAGRSYLVYADDSFSLLLRGAGQER
jgi:hypothetical protein